MTEVAEVKTEPHEEKRDVEEKVVEPFPLN